MNRLQPPVYDIFLNSVCGTNDSQDSKTLTLSVKPFQSTINCIVPLFGSHLSPLTRSKT
eukprot:UN00029